MSMSDSASPVLPMIARVLMATLFLVSGIRKAMAWGGTQAYFAKVGLPFPEVIVPLVVAIEILGALMLIVGWRVPIVASILAAYTLGASFLGHPFWSVEPAQFATQLNHFLKNIAIVGGFLMVIAFDRQRSGSSGR
jgi:putative oxidoreductase